jgi:hypothetical protein
LIPSVLLVSRFRPFALSRLSYAKVPELFARELNQVENSSAEQRRMDRENAKTRKREKDK